MTLVMSVFLVAVVILLGLLRMWRPFLNAREKRDISYNNAARFLRLSKADMARHHGRVSP